MKITFLIFLFVSLNICSQQIASQDTIPRNFKEEFNNQTQFNLFWEDASQNGSHQYTLENGMLKITTKAGSNERIKTKTRTKNYGLGTYLWRVYIPDFNSYEQCSIGAFVYSSKPHEFEFDFEVGSGTLDTRTKLHAKASDLILYCTSQKSPKVSEPFLISYKKWYTFKLELSQDINKLYIVKWFVANKLIKKLETNISTDITFGIYSSLENLKFIGDKPTTRDNYALFDYISYTKKN